MATRCPHKCSICRAIEAGLDHRPLSTDELISITGPLVEPSNGHGVIWSPETADAADALDVAYIDRDEVLKIFRDIAAALQNERGKRRGKPSDRLSELQEAMKVAGLELNEAEGRLEEARVAYYKLARRDSQVHLASELQADQEAQARVRREQAKHSRKSGRATLERLRKGGNE
ncbi:MAG: hypothetical protein ABSC51_10215 [Gaiellaceae bacterium]|jgi:hypothetical protein